MVIKTKFQSLLGADRTLLTLRTQKLLMANAYIKKNNGFKSAIYAYTLGKQKKKSKLHQSKWKKIIKWKLIKRAGNETK